MNPPKADPSAPAAARDTHWPIFVLSLEGDEARRAPLLDTLAKMGLDAEVLIGVDGRGGLPDWKVLLAIGALASVLNSVAQSVVFSGFILPESYLTVAAVYALGDVAGLFACLFALMLTFRWIRLWKLGA